MNVLGISAFYHDSSAAIIKDGILVAAAQEERFTRKKHDLNFPNNAIKYCLKEANIKIDEIDAIVFYEKPLLKFERLINQFVETFPYSYNAFVESIPSWLTEKLAVPSYIRKLGYKGKIYFLEHHLSHAASSFLVSPFKKAAILTIDGVGEYTTTSFAVGNENNIEIIKEIHFPHSLGLLYSTFTAYLGFTVNNAEYKVMGLSAYGKPKYLEEFSKIIKLKEDGSFALDMKYFDYMHKLSMPSKELIKLFDLPIRKPSDKITQKHKDIAASLQKVTEDTIFSMLNKLYELTKINKLCMAGGVALNSVVNGKIISETKFKDIYIQPAAGDAGGSIGGAFYYYNTILNNKRKLFMKNTYFGPSYSNTEIENFLKEKNIKFYKFNNKNELIRQTAKRIFENEVVGWFQGRMEWGPRALGARSILANPCNPKMQDILNLKVKHREKFRPFAPVIPIENAAEWFECDKPIPYPADFMLMVYPIKKEKRDIIPAVTHVDGSGRLQIIRKEQNPLYYEVIKEFEKLSGVPILINTSFNIRGEPIVCTPEDAYRCMMGTKIDCLIIGKYLIQRKDNHKDIWDSEKYAND